MPSRDAGSWLILGASGFIGTWIARELDRRGIRWVGTYRRRGESQETPSDKSLMLDLRDHARLEEVLDSLSPAVVVNALGHAVGASEEEMRSLYVEGTRTLLERTLSILPKCRVLMIGSAAEYGNAPEKGRSIESDPPHPVSAYGRTKAAQFHISSLFAARGMDLVTARAFNVIGPGQGSHLAAGALFHRLMNGERPLRVRNCNYIRDWVDVRDLARALVNLGRMQENPGVVNICTGLESSVEDLAREIARLGEGILDPEPGPVSADVVWRSVGDPTANRGLDCHPTRTMKQSLYDQWQSLGSPVQNTG